MIPVLCNYISIKHNVWFRPPFSPKCFDVNSSQKAENVSEPGLHGVLWPQKVTCGTAFLSACGARVVLG